MSDGVPHGGGGPTGGPGPAAPEGRPGSAADALGPAAPGGQPVPSASASPPPSPPAPGDAAPAALRTGRLRRGPRYGVFIATGALVGLALALLVTALRPGSSGDGVLGYLLVVFAAFGGLAGGLVAVLAAISLDRRERRSR